MLFSQDIAIDLGTANTLVFVKGKGIVMREPSVVAVTVGTKPAKVVAVGNQAKEMIGRTPGSITAMRPLRDGVIADFDITTEMLRKFIQKAMGASFFAKARVVICVPSGVTEVERRNVHDVAIEAGAKNGIFPVAVENFGGLIEFEFDKTISLNSFLSMSIPIDFMFILNFLLLLLILLNFFSFILKLYIKKIF